MKPLIYLADLSGAPPYGWLEEYLYLLPRDKRSRVEGYRFEKDKQLAVAAEVLLDMALREAMGGNPGPSERIVVRGGKPAFTRPGLHFSLSHSGDYALAAVCDSPVGADIQKRSSFTPALLGRVCTSVERDMILRSANPERLFTDIWTMKESYLKYTGRGIASLSEAVLTADASGGLLLPGGLRAVAYRMENYSVGCCSKQEGLYPQLRKIW